MPVTTPTLTAIASRISQHLHRFAANPSIAKKTWVDAQGVTREMTNYWNPHAIKAGSRCLVKYVAYQGTSSLTKEEAAQYLEWLEAGNVGTHWQALEGTQKVPPTSPSPPQSPAPTSPTSPLSPIPQDYLDELHRVVASRLMIPIIDREVLATLLAAYERERERDDQAAEAAAQHLGLGAA